MVTIDPRLTRAAEQIPNVTSGLSLLQQQLDSYGLDPVEVKFYTGRSYGNTVRDTSRQFQSLNLPSKAADVLAGNLGVIPSLNGQPYSRAPEPAERLQQADAQYILRDIKTNYPQVWRVLNNGMATENQLVKAVEQYYGDPNINNPTVRAGRELLTLGYKGWQHPNFNLDQGYVQSGGQRVWQGRARTSAHYKNKAIDFPGSHNTIAELDRLAAYLNSNAERLGVKSVLWRGVAGHGPEVAPDNYHVHVEFY